MSLVSLFVLVLVFGLLLYLVRVLPIDPPFKTAAVVILIIIAILVLLGMVGLVPIGDLRVG